MTSHEPTSVDRLEAFRAEIGARAAGWWRLRDEGLELVAFAAVRDILSSVALEFMLATHRVALSQTAMGIVKAAVEGVVVVSRVEELPPDAGSGLWLRRFGAARSVAVPVSVTEGGVRRIVSVALGGSPPDDAEVASAIRQAAASWPEAATA